MTINAIIVFIAEKKKLRDNLLYIFVIYIYIYIYIYISKYNPKIPKDVKTVMTTVEKKKKYLKEGI